jgi:Mor family transcriptional regulator
LSPGWRARGGAGPESKPERLLLAAIDYSQERLIVYAGPRPPRSQLRAVAERFGQRLVYIPLADLSPVTLRQIRVFHVLDGHPVRLYARQYIR